MAMLTSAAAAAAAAHEGLSENGLHEWGLLMTVDDDF